MARLVIEPVVLAQAVAVVLACSAFPVRLGAGLLRVRGVLCLLLLLRFRA
ncbi:Uncharacterised protein [Corynebacterium diphtheriae]|nr:Uncharacterised protein [Corynebacterium diphtheriae]